MITLRPRQGGPRREDALGLLLECHERIRHFTDLARRLADDTEYPADEIVASSRALLRYFTTALPLHEADEDLTVRPRLIEIPGAEEIVDSVAAMSREHVEIDALVEEELVPRWAVLIDRPADRATRIATGAYAQTLAELMWRHLEREERTIFPSIERLPADVREEIAAEIRGRRQP